MGEWKVSEKSQLEKSRFFIRNAMDSAIQIGLLFLLAAWCIDIIRPFVGIVAWAAIIAIALYPLHCKLAGALGGKEKLSVFIIVIIGLSILLIPAWILTDSSIDSAKHLSTSLEEGTLKVPPPGDKVEGWPIIGKKVHALWSQASTNLDATLTKYHDQVKDFSAWLLKSAIGTAKGVLGFVASIIIGGVLLLSADKSYAAFKRIGRRLGGDKGEEFTDLSIATVRSVAKGVLGVALIQTFLATVGMLVMGIPATGIFAGIILMLAIMQLPPALVLLPISIWVFSVADPVPATVFLVYSMLVSFSDGLLKPLLLGRGVDVPMLVILLGAIGGMITAGIIGLFFGAVILALGYQLFQLWLSRTDEAVPEAEEATES